MSKLKIAEHIQLRIYTDFNLRDLSNIPKEQMMVPILQGIQEIVDQINKSTQQFIRKSKI